MTQIKILKGDPFNACKRGITTVKKWACSSDTNGCL